MSDSGFYLLPRNKLYKKENTRRLKNFPAGYVGNFYRNLADNIDNFTGSDFYSRIAADADLPREDVQKYILATSDIVKSIQTDINHYVRRDIINDASFRQKLDQLARTFWGDRILLSLYSKTFPRSMLKIHLWVACWEKLISEKSSRTAIL